ncbi:uncharacterized protein LOC113781359 [Coffea eugenioides]|uniref:uncharacterized protein LOC113781359 n=1 Tax=Coffea eugenioides TaxID=49369 RepID=UPI000F60E3A0|nr:uncharacterized protein LOC113781359 [Coffea eugenioides]
MQRWCSKLRTLASALHSSAKPQNPTPISIRPLHISPNLLNKSTAQFANIPKFKALQNVPQVPHPSNSNPSHLPLSFFQVRHITAKQRKRRLKSRQPLTPITSKVKKIKMKCYSSFKGRFRVMNDGQIRRWKEGKRHNAHLKSKKARRRLRRPGTVPLAYAKVMKKLNFSG